MITEGFGPSLIFKKVVCLEIMKNNPRNTKCNPFSPIKLWFVENINIGCSIWTLNKQKEQIKPKNMTCEKIKGS